MGVMLIFCPRPRAGRRSDTHPQSPGNYRVGRSELLCRNHRAGNDRVGRSVACEARPLLGGPAGKAHTSGPPPNTHYPEAPGRKKVGYATPRPRAGRRTHCNRQAQYEPTYAWRGRGPGEGPRGGAEPLSGKKIAYLAFLASLLPSSSRRATSFGEACGPFQRLSGAPAFTATPRNTTRAFLLLRRRRMRRKVARPRKPA